MNAKLSFPLLALFVAGLASATSQVFIDLDSDHDDQVSKQEAAVLPVLAEIWDELDTDGDDQLSPSEFSQLDNTPAVLQAQADEAAAIEDNEMAE